MATKKKRAPGSKKGGKDAAAQAQAAVAKAAKEKKAKEAAAATKVKTPAEDISLDHLAEMAAQVRATKAATVKKVVETAKPTAESTKVKVAKAEATKSESPDTSLAEMKAVALANASKGITKTTEAINKEKMAVGKQTEKIQAKIEAETNSLLTELQAAATDSEEVIFGKISLKEIIKTVKDPETAMPDKVDMQDFMKEVTDNFESQGATFDMIDEEEDFINKPKGMAIDDYKKLYEAFLMMFDDTPEITLIKVKAYANFFVHTHTLKAVSAGVLDYIDMNMGEIWATKFETSMRKYVLRLICDMAIKVEMDSIVLERNELYRDEDNYSFSDNGDEADDEIEDEDDDYTDDGTEPEDAEVAELVTTIDLLGMPNINPIDPSLVAKDLHLNEISGSTLASFNSMFQYLTVTATSAAKNGSAYAICMSNTLICVLSAIAYLGVDRNDVISVVNQVFDEAEEKKEKEEDQINLEETIVEEPETKTKSFWNTAGNRSSIETPNVNPASARKKLSARRATKKISSTQSFAMTTMCMMMVFIIMVVLVPIVTAASDASLVGNFSGFLTTGIMATLDEVVRLFDPRAIGKLNASIYRVAMENIVRNTGTSQTTFCLTILFTCFIKSKERLLKAIDGSADLKANPDVMLMRNFIQTHCTSYVEGTITKIPLVKLPDCYSSLSVLYFSVFMPNVSLTELISTSFFGMMRLSDFLQDLHEMFTRFFWMVLTVSTHNTSASRNEKHKVGFFYTEIYANTKTDMLVPIFTNSKPLAAGFVTLNNVVDYMDVVRVTSGMEMCTMTNLIAPRQDWRMFHPRYTLNPDGSSSITGDYDRTTGIWTTSITSGLLSDWVNNLDEDSLSGAPSETMIRMDDTTSKFSFSVTHART